VKVVEKGRPQTGWAKEYKCTGKGNKGGGCGATLLVEQGDLFMTAHHCYDGSSDYYVTFKCCECGVLTDIPESDAPVRAAELPSMREWEKSDNDKHRA